MLKQKLYRALVVPGERKSDRFFRLFPWVWLIAAYGITLAVLCLYGRGCVDSDMASEMILSDILNRESGLLTTQWWYSTELQVFCLQMFYRVGLLLLPHNWYAARMVGQALFMLCLILSYLYVGHGLHLKHGGAWGAAALACPFGVWYLWYGPFGGFYLPYMILLLLGFGAMLHLLQPAGRGRRVAQWLLLLGTSGASGLNGLKGLMGFFLPMLAAAAVALALQWHLEPRQCLPRERRLLLLSVLATLIAGAGYGFYSTVLAAGHSFSDFNTRTWYSLDFATIANKWLDFLSLFGYPVDSFLGGEVELFSLEGILGTFGLLTAGAIVFSLVRLLWRWRELDPIQRLAPLLLGAVFVVEGLIFACTGEPQLTNGSYWLTSMPLVFPVLQLEGQTEHFRLGFTRRLAALAFCACFVLVSVGTTLRYMHSGYRVNPHLEEVCGWLTEQGYTQGYATFWNGNVLTEWSDGEIEMWVTNDFNTMEPYQWLQKTSHADPPEGPVFLLTTSEELNSMGLSRLYWWSNVVYEDDEQAVEDRTRRYIVMAYPDYSDMMNAIHGAQADTAG